MSSSFDRFVTAVQTQLNDSSVEFTEGTIEKLHSKTSGKRRIGFERTSGVVRFSSGPLTTVTHVTKHGRFARHEKIIGTVAAEDEDTLDILFNNLLNAIFDVCGPNAFVSDTEYEWGGKDSKGGGHVVRQPIIIFALTIRLKVSPPTPLSQVITDTSFTGTI